MCVRFRGEWYEVSEDMIAYKVCRVVWDEDAYEDQYRSMYTPRLRVVQTKLGFPSEESEGEDYIYEIGSTVRSVGHGIYLFMDSEDAVDWREERTQKMGGGMRHVVLRVRIPAGKKVRNAISFDSMGFDCPGINAEEIEVLGEYDEALQVD